MKKFSAAIAGVIASCVLCAPVLRAAAQVAPTETATSVDPHANETKTERDKRMYWWRQARFGMFIHWGLYSVPAGTWNGIRSNGAGEWLMHDDKIPVADYAALAKQFDPVQFNADTWVSIAKQAGMKYIVMTAKHHEGFAMFHTATDPYNIYDATPFKRDPIAEMAEACKKQGLKFGVYYSQAQDWHHAGGAAYGGHWDKAQDGDLDQYVRTISAPQVTELLTKYKPAVLWWDTSVPMSVQDIKELTAAFSKDPQLIANNRLGSGVPGDIQTPEQTIPPTGFPGRDWETCMTINDTWGYKSFDTDFKSTVTLLHNLIDIASKGGNYLLNVGPTDQGLIPEGEVVRLQQMGDWLRKNGQSIYGTTASPYKQLPFNGRVTVKGNAIYLNVFDWPESGLQLAGLKTAVTHATAIATGQSLDVTSSQDGTLAISKPSIIDPLSTVIRLDLDGPPVVENQTTTLNASLDGTFKLRANDAVLVGSAINVESIGNAVDIGFWTNKSDSAQWKVRIPSSTVKYSVSMTFSCQPGTEGSKVSLMADGNDTGVSGLVTKTDSWGDYQSASLTGVLSLSPGIHTLAVVPQSMPGFAVMNLRELQLTPVDR